MPAVLIILAILIAVTLYFDRGETNDDKHDDKKRTNHSNVADPLLCSSQDPQVERQNKQHHEA
jgi:hypothetical protein